MKSGPGDTPLFIVFQMISFAFRLLPRRLCLALGGILGLVAFLLDSKHRRLALDNLRLAFGSQKTPVERHRLALASFRRFGRVLADLVKWPSLGRDRQEELITLEGGENLSRALEGRSGALLFTGHFGNWEVGSLAVSRLTGLNVVARELDNARIEKKLLSFRRRLGARVIYKDRAARQILQALQRNEAVAIVIDQNVLRREGVFVEFFGRAASTTPGLASFHLRTGAPLLPIFSHPRPDSGYRIVIGPPVETAPPDGPLRDVLKITQACTKIIEEQVRSSPESWLWFHDRWRSRPMKTHGQEAA